MQLVSLQINNTIYISFSLLLSAFVVHLITKNLDFSYEEIKLVSIKQSAIVSLIITAIFVIFMYPLMLILIKNFIVGQLKISSNSALGLVIYIIVAILEVVPVIIVIMLRKEGLSSLGITRSNIFKSIFIGLVSYILFFVCIVIIKHKFKYIVIPQFSFSIWSLVNCLLTAFGEEVIFRGYVQYRLTKWLGDKKGLIISALIFSCSHISQRMMAINLSIINASILSILLFPSGLFLGYLFLKCKNITASTIFHALYDFFLNFI